MLPFNPAFFPFFVLILIIPEFPEASYLEDGLVMISICSRAEAGIFLSRFARSLGDKNVCLPSINTITPCFPLRLIAPSLFTIMPGDFSRISRAVDPDLWERIQHLQPFY